MFRQVWRLLSRHDRLSVRERRNAYYWEHEVLHTLVILNEGPQARVKDLVFSPNVLHSLRFFAALRMTTIICSE